MGVDIRPTPTFVMVTDLVGRQLATVTSFPTERAPKRFIAGLVKRVKTILSEHTDLGRCEGVGVVAPGMVESETGVVLLAPNLGWSSLQLPTISEEVELMKKFFSTKTRAQAEKYFRNNAACIYKYVKRARNRPSLT